MDETLARPEGLSLDDADWRVLRESALFKAIDVNALTRLCADRHVTHYAARQTIFSQGDPAEGLFLVLEGWVKIFRLSPMGEEAIFGLFTTGESFAEAAFFLGGAYPASAEAASRLRVLKIDAGRFQREMACDHGLAAALLTSLSAHAEQLFREIASLKLLPAPRRLAEFLLRATPAREGAVEVLLPYEKSLLAGRLGMSPETLSRALSVLKRLGVATTREHVAIPDVARLRAFASGEGDAAT